MFRGNLKGKIKRLDGYDVHGRRRISTPVSVSFAQVNLKSEAIETSVRADSSASRGAAEQISNGMAAILVPGRAKIAIDDIFSFEGVDYRVTYVHPRRSVINGRLDHYQCGLEIAQ